MIQKRLSDGRIKIIFHEDELKDVLVFITGIATVSEQSLIGGSHIGNSMGHDVEQLSLRNATLRVNPAFSIKKSKGDSDSLYAHSLIGLSREKQADEVIASLMSKANLKSPAQLRVFYTDVERELGIGLSKIYKNRINGVSDISKYPHRKMDTLLTLVSADQLYTFVESYTFKKKTG